MNPFGGLPARYDNRAESLEKVRFDGKSDPETVLVLYDALERLQYLAAVYAKANQTASP